MATRCRYCVGVGLSLIRDLKRTYTVIRFERWWRCGFDSWQIGPVRTTNGSISHRVACENVVKYLLPVARIIGLSEAIRPIWSRVDWYMTRPQCEVELALVDMGHSSTCVIVYKSWAGCLLWIAECRIGRECYEDVGCISATRLRSASAGSKDKIHNTYDTASWEWLYSGWDSACVFIRQIWFTLKTRPTYLYILHC